MSKSKSPSATAGVRTPVVADMRSTYVVNGRVVSRSLADPEVQDVVRAAVSRMFPTKEAARKYFLARGAKPKREEAASA